jgi:hypothetical protein
MRPRAIVAALLAALLAGCPSEKPSAPASTGSPAPQGAGPPATAGAVVPEKPVPEKPPADDVVLPGFEDVRKGQRYVFELTDGVTREDEIISRDELELVIRSTLRTGNDATTSERRQPLRGRPPASTNQPVSGSETVTISGKTFDCAVLESDAGGLATRRFRAAKFPFVIRVEAPPGTATLTLKEIREP